MSDAKKQAKTTGEIWWEYSNLVETLTYTPKDTTKKWVPLDYHQSQMELHQKIIEALNRRIAEANNKLDAFIEYWYFTIKQTEELSAIKEILNKSATFPTTGNQTNCVKSTGDKNAS